MTTTVLGPLRRELPERHTTSTFPENTKMTAHEDRVYRGNMTKIERYGWTVADEPGRFREIDKHALWVDDEYQRDPTEPKIDRIASEWSWQACGAIIVGLRHGRAYVIDGQHRVLAARKRSDITRMPCLVFDTNDVAEEAQAFLRANKNRKPMTALQAFKARVAAGDAVAKTAEVMIKSAGRVIANSSSSGSIKCVGELMKHIAADKKTLDVVWPLVVELSKGQAISNRLLRSLMHIEPRLKDGASLAEQPWRDRLMAVGADGLLKAAAHAVEYHGMGGERVLAEGMLKAINHRARTKILALRSAEDRP